MKTSTKLGAAFLAAGAIAATASADLTVTIENTNPQGGFFFTPFWVAVHNGGFDSYDGGTPASMWPGLTEIAEGGDTGPITAAFAASPAGIAGGVDTTLVSVVYAGDAPVFNPGEKQTFTIDPGDTSVNRYFSYASMVIPSNDLFVANGNPMAHELFDANGDFVGPVVIEVRAVNDNGTEVNDADGGAAFSALGGADADENVNIRNFFTEKGDSAYLDSFHGTETVTGFVITDSFEEGELITRITIDFEPAETCASDIDGDGVVGVDDLLELLANWGDCL